jgi:hypothetical protein
MKTTNKNSLSDEETEEDDVESLIDVTKEKVRNAVAAPSILSSDLDTTTFFDTENDDDDGQFSSITAETTNSTISSRRYGRNRRKLRHKHHHSIQNSLHSSMTSLTDSTMSLNIITVTLNLDTVNFLGISIVGQSNKGGEGGIYVGSIMSGGAVAQDGRIEPGDMILQVNDISFENMANDDAVRVLREAVMKPGPVKLVVAKCWDPNPKGYFTVSKQDPVRPIDPSAWVAHTQAHTGIYQNNYQKNKLTHSISSFGSSSSLTSSIADSTLSNTYNNAIGSAGIYNYNGQQTNTTNGEESTFRYGGNEQLNLTVNTDMETVVRAMAQPDSGLDVRDRNWLKITIQNAFIGSDIVDWLFNHVEGFPDRRDARKYACNMLRYGFIRHAVNKIRFSEQCYYIFGDFNQSTLNSQLFMNQMGGGNLFTLNEESEADFDSVSELDRDTLYAPMNFPPPPLIPPGSYNSKNAIYSSQQYQPKLYSNLNGIGGPPPPPLSYMSSSSSNATSNSTSTTSNNTTSQTIATNTTALGGCGGLTQNNSTTSLNSTSNQTNLGGAILNQDRGNACNFYYPPQLNLTSFNSTAMTANSSQLSNSMMSSASMYQSKQQQQTTFDSQDPNDTTQQSQYTINETTINNNNPLTNTIMSQSQYSISTNNYNQKNPNLYQNNNSIFSNSGNYFL